ncbi:MAG: heavy metal translocating P-type ATPase metal-binding domain-containing protein [Deltaproteobacteria bacterium]|nr:heavy metal translocating P-type ATPase metal-binding domain-containing protein [Deltaproteobacteria bacterium]
MTPRADPATPLEGHEGCLHCGASLPEGARDAYCCIGCRFVAKLLREEGLERYYTLRGPKGDPVASVDAHRDRKWLEPIEQAVAESEGIARVDLDMQGLSCAACVWVTEQMFRREKGGLRVVVNPGLGTLTLSVDKAFPLRRFVERIESLGYLLGPARKADSRDKDTSLMLRMGLSIALAMNGMIVAISLYAGLEHGPLAHFFRTLSFGFALASVAVGGSYFFRSAFAALRRGILHLDLPIALGILLAFGSSTWAFFDHDAQGYFDPLTVFVALMLVGRFIQQRVLDANRRRLLADDGVDALLTRRLGAHGPELVRCVDVKEGDRLLLAPGDVVPVEAKLEGNAAASLSLDWINGESAPRSFASGAVLPAGAFLGGGESRTVVAKQPFGDSVLVDLLRTPTRDDDDGPISTTFWRRFAQIYVFAVLALAAGAFIVALRFGANMQAALDRVTAVLIVTCPCAFGIAAPLAYQSVQARLRREGLFVRTSSFLDRATAVRRVVFDKTGTLTTGKLRVADPSRLEALDAEAKVALLNLATRSAHPKSAAVARALDVIGVREGFRDDLVAREEIGRGVELSIDGRTWRLGAPSWVFVGAGDSSSAAADDDVAFGVDGRLLASIETVEDLRLDAAREIRALREQGYDVHILSGDSQERVLTLAEKASVPADHAVGDHGPSEKAAWVAARDQQDTLVMGDGINDGPAVSQAFCSGTPAIDRPFLAARSDFYLASAGIRPVRLALEAARRLRRVVVLSLGVALAYNVVTIALAYAGLMTPLLCAVLMPTSSITTILAVIVSLAGTSWHAAPRLETVPKWK